MRRVPATTLVSIAVACCLALTGCAPTGTPRSTPSASASSSYPRSLAARLQAAVLTVSSAAAAGDPASALSRLDELAAALADARAKNEVTAARFDSISASIALVRTDLEAAVVAQNQQNKPGKTDKPGKPGHGKDR